MPPGIYAPGYKSQDISPQDISPQFLAPGSSHYYECVSYARLRIGVVSQPFCVDQLNPAGFNVFYVPYKENSRFFPARETGNLKINMAESDLSPTTFHFQFSQ